MTISKVKKPQERDNLTKLLNGQDPVEWAFLALVEPKRKNDLGHLIDLLGHDQACDVICTVLSDQARHRAVAEDWLENHAEYYMMSGKLRIALAFPFFCNGFIHQACEMSEDIKDSSRLGNESLITHYFMFDSYQAGRTLVNRISDNPSLLVYMNHVLEKMIHAVKSLPSPGKKEWDNFTSIKSRIEQYSPVLDSFPGLQLMEFIAKSPEQIALLRGKTLDALLADKNKWKESGVWMLNALNHNPSPEVVYAHNRGGALRTYTLSILNFHPEFSDELNERLLSRISDFAQIYLHLEGVPSGAPHPIVLHGLINTCRMALSMKFTPVQLDILIELTRLLTPDYKPLANPADSPIDRLMALSPLLNLQDMDKRFPTTLVEAIKDYAAKVAREHHLKPEDLAALVHDDKSALLVGKLIDDTLVKDIGNESLLTWKFEDELGL